MVYGDFIEVRPSESRKTLGEIADGVAKLAREKLEEAPFRLPPLNSMSTAPRRLGGEAALWVRGRGLVEARYHAIKGAWVCDALQDDSEYTAYIQETDCIGWWPVPEVREG